MPHIIKATMVYLRHYSFYIIQQFFVLGKNADRITKKI